MDLIGFLKSHIANEKASFHMPGHKGPAFFERAGFGDIARDLASVDITEIPGADDLRHPEGVIRDIEERYRRLYGSDRALISVNGSSAAIMAAIRTVVEPGHKIILPANSHISAVNGAELAGAGAVFMEDHEDHDAPKIRVPGTVTENELPLFSRVTAASVAEALENSSDADAVVIVSPDYLGTVSDVESIADEVHKRGKVLIVDQAHGAHLKFFDEIKGSRMAAEGQSADIVVNSTHKTLASFTQSSEVNLFATDGGRYRFDPKEFSRELLRLESTSPSYILMASHAVNVAVLEDHRELIREWTDGLDAFYEEAKSSIHGSENIEIIGPNDAGDVIARDYSKIVIRAGDAGAALGTFDGKGIVPEFSSGDIILMMSGIGNTKDDYRALLSAIMDIARG